MKATVRIGGGLGYWGDDISAPGRLVREGRIDYLVMDFLAEVTMSILRKQMQREPEAGYATDIIPILRDVLPDAVERGVTIICNAGGMNPAGCARRVQELASELGVGDKVRIAAVSGDDLMPHINELADESVDLDNIETGEPFSQVADRIASANVYIGAEPVVEALRRRANVVITGRVADPSLTLGALRYEFGWKHDEWDLLAAGIVAGHLIECGAHVTGGNHQAGWQDVPDMAAIGFPIVEVDAHGRIELGKTPGSGGLVDETTTIEQLLYEIGDPRAYLTPDVTADWTTLRVSQLAPDLVEITGATGRPAPSTLKVSACYADGYSTSSLWLYSAPDAVGRARKAREVLEQRIARLGLPIEEVHWDLIGTGAVHEHRTPRTFGGQPSEVVLRFAARSDSREALQRVVVELGTVFHGPPGKTTLSPGRARVSAVMSYWPALVPRELIRPAVELLEEGPRS
ncbi:acyclic terpene utilization AtuA family protein [Streptomyces sp. NPDC096310]|uniref:acyclic terpene utilization AtuA family protein n=1 Tax=Streptomyces sp. NPDC096310 TaxID=3366082 RepID=UPI00382446D7